MEKFLYFAVSATDSATYPSSAFRGVEVTTDQKLQLYFASMIDTHQDATADEYDKIILSCGTDEKAAIKAIVDAISATGSMKEAFVTIADSVNSVFVAGVTACDSTAYTA